ncbi:MFS transporter [Streptomyces spiroverticillatus]|uniref:MFS transporter n=1 Tax=Streptomyces finlayi TaxID=67296 RepID=A0A918WVF5_9ACTN|nr:MFS transporter [Streptomyces finlayi]GHA02725.1 MFS transporter [Streptomyces spiroverticillatus]GHC86956.1 MFS transporter [Streptomyces finlayi]
MALDDETAVRPRTSQAPLGRFKLGPLYVTIPLANLVLYMIWTAIPQFMLPIQVQRITGTTDTAALATASLLGTIAATIGNPLFGQLSDRTRSRFGRRTPWLVACAIGGGALLLLQANAPSISMLGIAYAGTSLVLNGFQAALTAVVPDRVPGEKMGLVSSLMGVGLNLGVLVGSSLFAIFPELAGPFVYYLIAAAIVITAVVFAVLSPDVDSREEPREPFHLGRFFAKLWINPVKHPDFGWVFLARMFMMLGYWLVTALFFFALQDYVGLSPEDAVGAAGILFTVSGAASVVGSLLAAPLVDRVGRLKVFVLVAGGGLAISLAIPVFSPTYGGMMVFSVVNGLAFGIYTAVDTALINKVLPNPDDAAKDLGVMNIATALPQIVAAALGALVVSLLDYRGLFVVAAVIALVGAVAVIPVKRAR